jgi:hypothetical protein
MSATHTTAIRNAFADLITTTCGATGRLVFRTSGTANAPGAAVATLTLANPIGGAASSGVVTLSTITPDTNAAGGTVANATLGTAAGTIAVHFAVGTSGSDLNMTSGGLVITAGDTVSCSSLTYTACP